MPFRPTTYTTMMMMAFVLRKTIFSFHLLREIYIERYREQKQKGRKWTKNVRINDKMLVMLHSIRFYYSRSFVLSGVLNVKMYTFFSFDSFWQITSHWYNFIQCASCFFYSPRSLWCYWGLHQMNESRKKKIQHFPIGQKDRSHQYFPFFDSLVLKSHALTMKSKNFWWQQEAKKQRINIRFDILWEVISLFSFD